MIALLCETWYRPERERERERERHALWVFHVLLSLVAIGANTCKVLTLVA